MLNQVYFKFSSPTFESKLVNFLRNLEKNVPKSPVFSFTDMRKKCNFHHNLPSSQKFWLPRKVYFHIYFFTHLIHEKDADNKLLSLKFQYLGICRKTQVRFFFVSLCIWEKSGFRFFFVLWYLEQVWRILVLTLGQNEAGISMRSKTLNISLLFIHQGICFLFSLKISTIGNRVKSKKYS